jgi:streptogramin lyase
LWFGEYAALGPNVGARWNSDGSFTFIPGEARVYVSGVAVTTNGTAWFAAPRHFNGQWDQGPQRIVLTKVAADGESSTVIAQGSHSNRPKGLAAASDGSLWFTSDSQGGPGWVWRITANGQQTRIVGSTMPTHQVKLGAITQGPDGAMWFLDLSRGAIGRISKPGTKVLKCKPAKVPSWAVQP